MLCDFGFGKDSARTHCAKCKELQGSRRGVNGRKAEGRFDSMSAFVRSCRVFSKMCGSCVFTLAFARCFQWALGDLEPLHQFKPLSLKELIDVVEGGGCFPPVLT